MDSRIPDGIGPMRRALLDVVAGQIDLNIREIPRGSNRGPEIDKYFPRWRLNQIKASKSKRGDPWCAWAYSWCAQDALGDIPTGVYRGGTLAIRRDAERLGLWLPKGSGSLIDPVPRPGDAFWMDTDDGGPQGHIGFVFRVSKDGQWINTGDPNSANTFRFAKRWLGDDRIKGFINMVRNEPNADFEYGIIEDAPNAGPGGTR